MKYPAVLYDATCPFCTFWAVFLARHHSTLSFIPIASPLGHKLCQHLGINPHNPGTFAYLPSAHKHLFKSQGILALLATLPGYTWAQPLGKLPQALLNPAYTLVARTRFILFGRYQKNRLPAALKSRTLTKA